MQNKSDNILIVCFSFPPFPGIGGRRWAKFAKYLSQNSYHIHTLSAENVSDNISEWNKDLKDLKIKSHTIPLGLSKILSFNPITFIQKVIHKLFWKIGPFLIKGNSQDKVFFVKSKFLTKAEKIIKSNDIKTVIVTIPPYKLAYYLLPLKKKFPELKLIVDYRDPWTDNKSYHGFYNINADRLKEETKYELEVLNTYDIVLNVNSESLETLKQKESINNKFYHLSNGYDTDDYILNEGIINEKTNKIKFIYSGSFYPNLIYLLNPLIKCIHDIKNKNPELYSKLEFNFYGNIDHKAKECISKSGLEALKYHGHVTQNKIIEATRESNYCMLFSAPDHASVFNTKFYEYTFLRKPIIYFGPKGELSNYILKNNIGSAFTPEQLELSNSNHLLDLINSNKEFNTNLDISHFDIKNITKNLIEIINA